MLRHVDLLLNICKYVRNCKLQWCDIVGQGAGIVVPKKNSIFQIVDFDVLWVEKKQINKQKNKMR